MSEDSQKGHFGAKRLNKLHKKVKKTEDGACLTGHQPSFEKKAESKKVTCNYRYQGFEQAKSHRGIKWRLHSYRTTLTAPIRTALKVAPPRYCVWLDPPGPGDWDLDGPTKGPIVRKNKSGRKVTIPKGMNFSQDTWPYWNNAHHLIPKGTLKEVISNEPSPINNLIQQGLLTALYNVNHKKNMLLMPQDMEVAKELSMPRHIQLKEGDDTSISAQVFNHPEYNTMVSVGLDKVMTSYRKSADNANKRKKKPHEVPNVRLSKKKLETLSKNLLRWVLAWGKDGKGSSLDSKSKAVLNKKTKAQVAALLTKG